MPMPALQVKDCPAETYELLRECSARENRSISQQTLTIIEQYLGLRGSESNSDSNAAHSASEPTSSTQGISSGDFLAKRHTALERINALPSFDLPKGFDSTANLVVAARGERW